MESKKWRLFSPYHPRQSFYVFHIFFIVTLPNDDVLCTLSYFLLSFLSISSLMVFETWKFSCSFLDLTGIIHLLNAFIVKFWLSIENRHTKRTDDVVHISTSYWHIHKKTCSYFFYISHFLICCLANVISIYLMCETMLCQRYFTFGLSQTHTQRARGLLAYKKHLHKYQAPEQTIGLFK